MKTAISKARNCAPGPNAIGDGSNHRIRTQKTWKITGEIRGVPITKRISAPSKDTAMYEAHYRGISVRGCTQIPATRK